MAALVPAGGRPVVGVDGVDGAGKTTFADELAHALAPRPVVRVSVDDFHHPLVIRHRRGRDSPEGFWLDSFDYPRLIADVFEPLRAIGRYRARAHDLASDAVLDPEWEQAPDGAAVVVDGLFLHRAELAGRFDLTVFLDVPFEVTARRLAGRDGPAPRGNDRYVGAALRYFAACDPKGRADVVVDNTDLAAPIIVACRLPSAGPPGRLSAGPTPPTPTSSRTST